MKLYVGNLSYKASENDLQDLFSQAGIQVDSVSIIRDKFSGEPRGFGFVEIADGPTAELAIRTCNGKECMGRAVVINEARPMTPGGGGGGGGRPPRGGSRERRH